MFIVAPEGNIWVGKNIYIFGHSQVDFNLLSFHSFKKLILVCVHGMAMSFSIPPLFRRRDKKPSETKCYPTLASICQPRLSSSSKSYQSSNSAHAISPYEELEDNDFYLYIRSNHDSLFKKSCVVCIPCSRQLHGLALNRNLIGKWNSFATKLNLGQSTNQLLFMKLPFLDAHSFSRSPYYQGQYQSASGKVISIEQEAVITISGKSIFQSLSSGVRRKPIPSQDNPQFHY